VQQAEELARRAYAAWAAHDVETFVEVCQPECRFQPSGAFPGLAPVYEGHDGMRDMWRDIYDPWQRLEVEVAHLESVGVDKVVALLKLHAVGRDGVKVHRPAAHVLTFRGGKFTEGVGYGPWSTALAAVGL
jgi:ketosteroid isomerase-like protein